jgi:hypothetical protein
MNQLAYLFQHLQDQEKKRLTSQLEAEKKPSNMTDAAWRRYTTRAHLDILLKCGELTSLEHFDAIRPLLQRPPEMDRNEWKIKLEKKRLRLMKEAGQISEAEEYDALCALESDPIPTIPYSNVHPSPQEEIRRKFERTIEEGE